MGTPRSQHRRRLLVLGAGPAQLGLLEAARALDLYVIAVDRDPSAPGFEYADRRAVVSIDDEPAVERLATAENVDALIAPGIDAPLATAARIARRLALPHPLTPESAVLAASKVRQRDRFAEEDVPQPQAWVCGNLGEAATAAEELEYPVVVKPPDRQGQRGISLAHDKPSLALAVDAAVEASRSGACLVEELLDGPEVTVNAFSVGGRFFPLTVTDRERADPPAFGVALAHVWPSILDPVSVGGAVEVAARAAAALDITDGPTYTQLVIAEDGPRVVELAARLGGGHDAELCTAALGIDLNELALAAALGEEIPLFALAPAEERGGACVRFLVAPAGELQEVAGVEEAEAVDGVEWVRVYRGAGHRYGLLRGAADRAGAVLAVGGSRAEAVERATRAAELVRFSRAGVDARALAR